MKSSKVSRVTTLWQRYAVCILALFILALSPAYASQLTSGVTFTQVSFTASNPPDNYSHYGQVSVDYTMLYGEGYINVERYENGQAAGWVVKNLPVVSGSVLSAFSTLFDLGHSGYQSSLSAYLDYSRSPLTDDSSLREKVPSNYPLGQSEYPLSPPTADGSVFYSPANQPAPKQAAVTVAAIKDPDGGTGVIAWLNPAKAEVTIPPITFQINKGDTPAMVAKAIEVATNAWFQKNNLPYTAKATGATVKVNGGQWSATNQTVISLTLE